MENIVNLCNKYNINILFDDSKYGKCMGIGDILFNLLCMKNNILEKPIYINLAYFTNTDTYANPLNQLEFRIKLIFDLLNNNENLSINDVIFIYSNNLYICQEIPYNIIDNYKLIMPFHNKNNLSDIYNNILQNKYIIFHTKCRHNATENYSELKLKCLEFSNNFKCKYNIVIMGEQTFPITYEINHQITTVYNQLLPLNNNNCVFDITKNEIYNNLDYDDYINDVALISNAQYNICLGQGGQLCSSIVFGNNTIFYYKINNINLNDDLLQKNNHIHFTNLDVMFDYITNIIQN